MILIEMAHEIGLSPKWVAGTEGGEYKSSCPRCGGVDRFSIQPNKQMKNCVGRYYCRQCGSAGDAISFARDFLGLSFQEAVDRTNATVGGNKVRFPFIEPKQQASTKVAITRPSSLWQEKAKSFTMWAHERINSNAKSLEWLRSRGLSLEAIEKYKIGWCSTDLWRERSSWGIDASEGKKLWLPQGVVIPTFDKKGNVLRIKIRRDNYRVGDEVGKYIVVSGSMNGLGIIGDARHKIT